jgi:ssRNA-specific RNase YbeY (16S rRNA maturation enzyme)
MPAKFFEQEIKSGLKNKRKLSAFLDGLVSKYRKGVEACELTYIFCSDDFLLEMNQQYLNHDTLTDIITFDMSESKKTLQGEIYISIDRVKENQDYVPG